MKGAIILLLAIIASGVSYLAFKELQQQNAIDEYQVKMMQSRVADGLRLSGGPKAAVTEYYNDFSKFPMSFNEAGVSINAVTLPGHVKSINLGSNGVIVISYEPRLLGLPFDVSEAAFMLKPDPTSSGTLSWICVASKPFGTYKDLVPAACRP